MMAVDEDERILLVKQFRLPAEKDLWELPAGRIDPGETALAGGEAQNCAKKPGYQAKKWVKTDFVLDEPRLCGGEDEICSWRKI